MQSFMFKEKFHPVITTVIVLAMIFVGCQKDDENTPPVVPPESSFVMDFSDFLTAKSVETVGANTYVNRALAITHVAVWNTVIYVNLAVPVATFRESFNHTPQLQENGSWKWTFNVTVGIHTYTASLFGKVNGSNVNWEMYVSKTGPGAFANFLWFTGMSNINQKSGTWRLYNAPGNSTPIVDIEWYKNSNNDFGIKYTNVIPGGNDNGSYISHGKTTAATFNAFYEIYIKSQNNKVNINWNTQTKAGQIKDPKTFGTGSFYCWDAMGKDISCN